MRRDVLSGLIVIIGTVLTCCGPQTPAEPKREREVRRPPQPACDQARTDLARRSSGGAFLFEETGAAMIDREAWLRMEESSRDRLIETLAVLAGCNTAVPQREVQVTIRAENGIVLVSRHVRPSTDFRAGAE